MANVTGPASSTDTAIARWNGTSGTVIQDSGVTIDGSSNIAGLNSISSDGGAFTSDGSGNVTLTSLTGSPTTTTQSSGDNSTKIATTAYVDNGLSGLALDSLSDCITNYTNKSIYIGEGVGGAITTGELNTGLGAGAMAALESGNNHTAFGYLTLAKQLSNGGNTAIGCLALSQSDYCEFNTAVGNGALVNLVGVGNDANVAIGFAAGSFTSGTGHVVVGVDADVVDGMSNCTAVGAGAGCGSSYSTAIGADAGVNSGLTNAMAIGYQATATSSNTVQIGNSSVTAVYFGSSGATLGTDLALAGNPTATTQSSGNNSTRIATTAFVQAALPGLATTSVPGIVEPDGATIDVSGGVISVPTATTSLLGLVKPDGATVDVSSGTISVPTATTSLKGLVKPDGSTINVSSGTISVPTATTGLLGLVKPDGATIDVSSGVISVPTATTSVLGLVKTDGSTITNSSGAISVTTATTSQLGAVQPDGSTIDVSSGVISVPTATTSVLGLVKPDGVTIGISGGVISALNAGQFSGFVNKFRNGGMLIAQRGTSGASGSSGYTLDGWIISTTGGSVDWAQTNGAFGSPPGGRLYGLEIQGETGNTDVKLSQRIESQDAIWLAGQTVTVQFTIANVTGSTITPTITTAYPTAADNWSSSTTDLSTTNLQSIANNVTATVAYTFTPKGGGSGAAYGYQIVIDFGAINSNTKVVYITAADIRVTPGVATGLNASPPAPEIVPIAWEMARNQRYYETSYGNGVAPGTSTTNGMSVGLGPVINGVFAAAKRAAPSISIWDSAGNSGKYTNLTTSGAVNSTNNTPNTSSALGVSAKQFYMNLTANTGNTDGFHWTASAEL